MITEEQSGELAKKIAITLKEFFPGIGESPTDTAEAQKWIATTLGGLLAVPLIAWGWPGDERMKTIIDATMDHIFFGMKQSLEIINRKHPEHQSVLDEIKKKWMKN